MTTLQRSSVSFRRQGSSGRIWDNVHIGQTVAAATSSERREDRHLQNAETSKEEEEGSVADSSSGESPAHSKREDQDQADKKPGRCGLSSIFRRCIGPPTA